MQSMRLCKALAQKHEVTVFTRTYNARNAGREQVGGYILLKRKISSIPVIKSFLDLLKVLSQIRQYKNSIQIYLSFHIQLAALMVVLGKMIYGTKAAVSPRGVEDFDFKWHKKLFQKFIYRKADLIIIQSPAIEKLFLQNVRDNFRSKPVINRIASKIRIFPNGIDAPTGSPTPITHRKKQVIFVGRLESIKGVYYLIEAWKRLATDYELVIVGSGTMEEQYKSSARNSNISFKGKCSEQEVKALLLQSRLLVLPSLSENFPNVILEAFSLGVPVVASSVGAVPELIEEGITGYLVPPGNIEMLVEKIKLALDNELTLDEMGNRAFQTVGQFSWEKLVHKFELITKTL